jgi:indolepyruvate ferredoxin oxidoreductase alpha subunit
LLARLAGLCREILVLEDGYPFVEERLAGLLPPDGELTPDLVRRALRLPARPQVTLEGLGLPGRPPQLCQGCPHRDSYDALKMALEGETSSVVAADIGCYTLGALPPYQAIESCVCMGASIGMARGAAAAGLRPAVAVIGDSTFLHSGVPPLMDAVAEDADMTVVILDNQTVGMTGAQQTVLPSSRLESVVRGIGVNPEHLHVVEAHPTKTEAMAEVLRRELAHRGLSVVIAVRTCVVAAKRTRGQPVAE